MENPKGILIVDDSATTRSHLVTSLRQQGFLVEAAPDGGSALEVLGKREFDAILLDCHMPSLSGIETLARIRAIPAPVYLPVLMVTADANSEAVIAALERGASDYLVKPVSVPILLARLKTQLARRQAEQESLRLREGLEVEVFQRTAEFRRAYEELRAVEQALEAEVAERTQAEMRFRQLVELTPHALVTVNSEGKIVLVNGRAETLFGHSREEMVGQAVDRLIPERLRKERSGFVGEFMRDPSLRSMGLGRNLWGLHKDGQEFPIDVSLSPVETPDGPQVIASIVDLTDIRRAEMEVRAQRQLLQNVIDSFPQYISVRDRAGRYQIINASLKRMHDHVFGIPLLGLTLEEAARNAKRKHPLIGKIVEGGKLDREVLATEHPALVRAYPYPLYEGDPTFRQRYIFPLRDPADTVLGVLSWSEDVTERLRSEAANRLLAQIVEQVPEGILIADASRRIEYLNSALEVMLGYSRAELRGRDPDVFRSPRHGEDFYAQVQVSLRAGMIWKGEISSQRKDGSEMRLDASVSPVLGPDDKITHVVYVVRDASARIQAQEQLAQTQKLEAMGTLVAGVAHEISNPNHFVMLNAPLLKDIWEQALPILNSDQVRKETPSLGGLSMDDALTRVPQLVDAILNGSRRIRDIVEDLKNFARAEPMDLRQRLDVNALVRSTIVFTRNRVVHSTRHFGLHLAEDIPVIRGNRQRLQQVLVNLINNACDSLPDRNHRIDVTTGHDAEGGHVWVEVRDEGIGIGPGDLARVKDPFFTTKSRIGGSGLGLSVSDGIVREHGGTLAIESNLGEGTRAIVELPLAPPGVERAEATPDPRPAEESLRSAAEGP